jgi:hypothetical protein
MYRKALVATKVHESLLLGSVDDVRCYILFGITPVYAIAPGNLPHVGDRGFFEGHAVAFGAVVTHGVPLSTSKVACDKE